MPEFSIRPIVRFVISEDISQHSVQQTLESKDQKTEVENFLRPSLKQWLTTQWPPQGFHFSINIVLWRYCKNHLVPETAHSNPSTQLKGALRQFLPTGLKGINFNIICRFITARNEHFLLQKEAWACLGDSSTEYWEPIPRESHQARSSRETPLFAGKHV